MKPRPTALRPSLLLSIGLLFSLPRTSARAENAVSYEYENYREDDHRISVQTESATLDADVAADGHLRLTGTLDAVAGATPTGRPAPPGSDQVALTEIHTRRKAWSGDYAEQIGRFNIDAGFAESRESDYVSYGWSLNTLTDFNEKNTTLRVGLAGTDDRVEVFFEPAYLPKHTRDAIVGVTQLLDPLTFVTVNLTVGQADGYLPEPHKFVEKAIEILPGLYLDEAFGENSPEKRTHETVYASVNRAVPRLRGALEASYRFYADTFGITAHTAELTWLQHVGAHLLLEPTVRYYIQGAARFYYYNLDATGIVPVRVPNGSDPYYSSDFRLSAEDGTTYGLKAAWQVRDWLQLNAGYDRYVLRGRDGVTPQSAYPSAGITSAGLRFLW